MGSTLVEDLGLAHLVNRWPTTGKAIGPRTQTGWSPLESAVSDCHGSSSENGRGSMRATIACYQDDVNVVATPHAESLARSTFIEEMRKIGLVVHKLSVFTPPGRQPHPDRQLRQDPRALILRHGAPCPVPALQDVSSEGDTMTHSDSPEVHQLLAKRSGMTQRLLQLRDAGLSTQFALAMFRYAIAGDATFLARTCGIPPRAQIDLDHITTRTACALLHADDITETTRQRIFLPTRLGGLGMWSAIATARAAFTASWIATLGKLRQWTRKSTQELGEQLPGLSSVLRDIQDYAEHTNETDINTETLHTMALNVNQRSLSQVNIEKVYEQILQSMAGDFRATAQFLSCGGPGAGAFTFSPRTSRAEMDDKSFIVAARLRIGIPMGDHVTHCHKSCDDNICGAEIDELQTHALICQLSGLDSAPTQPHQGQHCAHFERKRTVQRCSDRTTGAGSIRELCGATDGYHRSWATGSTRSHRCDSRLCSYSDSASLRQRHENGCGGAYAGDQQISKVSRCAGHTCSPGIWRSARRRPRQSHQETRTQHEQDGASQVHRRSLATDQCSAPDWKRPSSHRIAQRHILAHGCRVFVPRLFPGSSVLRQCQGAVICRQLLSVVCCARHSCSALQICVSVSVATSMAHM